ncbi:MAG: hypothetical protein WDM71_06395 [Ferruginibacter sp.]
MTDDKLETINFVSMNNFFNKVVDNASLHARWLNTLSMMENAGAKKIKKCEHPVLTNEIILKHSAEEARHAYYLKKQIKKVVKNDCPTYEKKYLLAPNHTYYIYTRLTYRFAVI